MPDLEAYHAAGLYDPDSPAADDRALLLAYLESEGATLSQMLKAHARGRLFALVGDRRILDDDEEWTLTELAARLGESVDDVRMVWRAYGLVDPGPDVAVAGPSDLEPVRTFFIMRAALGEEGALAIARVSGAAVSRVADAASAAVRSVTGDLNIALSGSEVVTARAFAEATSVVERMTQVLDVLLRHHLDVARRQFEESDSLDVARQRGVRMGVGFADLSGFTRTSQTMPLEDLARLVSGLEDIAGEVVSQGGGRVVKYIGDAVMFVAPRLEQSVAIALNLAEHPAAQAIGMPVRVGVAFGTLLAQEGDYFGPSVNLASRLVSLAEPGSVLADATMCERLDPALFGAEEPHTVEVRGWDAPVQVARIRRAASVTPNPVR